MHRTITFGILASNYRSAVAHSVAGNTRMSGLRPRSHTHTHKLLGMSSEAIIDEPIRVLKLSSMDLRFCDQCVEQ